MCHRLCQRRGRSSSPSGNRLPEWSHPYRRLPPSRLRIARAACLSAIGRTDLAPGRHLMPIALVGFLRHTRHEARVGVAVGLAGDPCATDHLTVLAAADESTAVVGHTTGDGTASRTGVGIAGCLAFNPSANVRVLDALRKCRDGAFAAVRATGSQARAAWIRLAGSPVAPVGSSRGGALAPRAHHAGVVLEAARPGDR